MFVAGCTSPLRWAPADRPPDLGPALLGALLEPTPTVALQDVDTNAFGLDVDGGADLDGDGRPDVIVGAPGGSYRRGRVEVFAGSDAGAGPTPSRLEQGKDSCFGQSVAIAGDLNGDRHADLLWNDSCTTANGGRVHMKLGGPGVFVDPIDQVLEGDAMFGFRLFPAGDVDGDGLADVLVGTYGDEAGSGRLALHRGTASGLSDVAWDVVGPASPAHGTGNAATVLDLDGDGYDDLVVEEFPLDMVTKQSRVVAWRGGPDGYDDAPWQVWEGPVDDGFGQNVASAGDVDGDGDDELLIGVLADRRNRGAVHVVLGSPDARGDALDQTLLGEEPGARFGGGMLGAGDLNGDGYGDVLVWAYGRKDAPGRVFAFSGGPDGVDTTARQAIVGFGSRDMFGDAMARAGDVDRDGRGDVWISAYNEELDDDYPGEGRVYLFRGTVGGPAGVVSDTDAPDTGAAGDTDTARAR